MALTRAALIAAVAAELSGVLTLAGFSAADSSRNMKEITDRSLRALNVSEANLATAIIATGSESQAISYLRYFTLAKAVMQTASKMDVSATGASAKLSQQYDHLKEMLALALSEAQSYGLPLPGLGQSGAMPVPFAGGMSQASYAAIAADGDRMPPLFQLEDIAISGVDPVTWPEVWQW